MLSRRSRDTSDGRLEALARRRKRPTTHLICFFRAEAVTRQMACWMAALDGAGVQQLILCFSQNPRPVTLDAGRPRPTATASNIHTTFSRRAAALPGRAGGTYLIVSTGTELVVGGSASGVPSSSGRRYGKRQPAGTTFGLAETGLSYLRVLPCYVPSSGGRWYARFLGAEYQFSTRR